MRLLGAILAGGNARRFGSDKASAKWNGKPLMDWVAQALVAQCESVALCGRVAPGFLSLPDTPHDGLGPLGGLNAALSYASLHGFTHVLSAGVDAPNLPVDLKDALAGEGAAIVDSQPVVGLWPSSILAELDAYISQDGRALYGFANRIGARRITLATPLMNVNRPDDLAP
ncbi:MAG: molybdenum cofactor guanylyltransferase [Pseudomonadota bacterium]